MSLVKKAVGRTPTCSPARLARIDPVWIPGTVPSGFWNDLGTSPRLPALVAARSQ